MKREQDVISVDNIKLNDKVGTLCNILRLSWEEQGDKLTEAEAMIE